MILKNFLEVSSKITNSHDGNGLVEETKLFKAEDFDTKFFYSAYTEIPPQASIGYHQHGEDEEIYVILGGNGQMTVNGEVRAVKTGDVILNKPGYSHGLENNSECLLKILVFIVKK